MFRVVFYSHGGHASDAPCDAPSDAKVSFFDNLLKKLDSNSSSQKNIWFSVSIPKIKFDPPPQGKNAFVFIF